MEMVELLKIFDENRHKMSNKVEFYIGYTLLNLLIKGKDEIPNVGEVSLIDKNGKQHLVIKLEDSWQKLFSDDTPIDAIFEILQRNFK